MNAPNHGLGAEDTFDDFLRTLSSTPIDVGELDLDGRSRIEPVSGVPTGRETNANDNDEHPESAEEFEAWLGRRQRIAPLMQAVIDELTAQAVDNPAAARLNATDGAALASPLPISQVTEAVLETGLDVRLSKLERGVNWRCRFADLAIIRSPLSYGTYEDHQDAVLSAPFGNSGVQLRDAIFAAGAFPEVSQVLIDDLSHELELAERDVIIHCPYYLRNRPESSPHEEVPEESFADPDVATPQDGLSGLIVTSLGWGGAANVGTQLARWWNWGFTSAVQANLAGLKEPYSFGDWNDDPRADLRQSELAARLMRQSHELLRALPALSHRIIALDHPVGAISALQDLVPQLDEPLGLVVITMDDRRVRFVARHMLTEGGRYSNVNDREVEATAKQLLGIQADLVETVNAHSDALPTIVVSLHDHLQDGYTDSRAPIDPVDTDFDSFCDTAVEVREEVLRRLMTLRTAGLADG